MNFLAETDETFADAKTELLRSEIICKRVRSRCFVAGEGSVEMRKASADIHPEAIAADDVYCHNTLAFEALKARRGRAEILIDVFRTLEASRRKT